MPTFAPNTRLRGPKHLGAHDTPPSLAEFLARRVLGAFEPIEDDGRPISVLDPACGMGNLLAAVGEMAPAQWRGRLTLIGCERDAGALELARRRIVAPTARFHQADFLDPNSFNIKCEYVDVILANPPYVRTQVLGAERSRELARRFGLSGRVDLYQAFLRAITDSLRPGGVLGLIASNRFLSVRAGVETRRLLGSAYDLIDLIDLGDTRLFPRAAVLPAVVVARKRGGASQRLTSCAYARVYACRGEQAELAARSETPRPTPRPQGKREPDVGVGLFEAIEQGEAGVIHVEGRALRIEWGTLAPLASLAAPWVLTHPARAAWIDQVEARAAGTLGEVGKVRVGIKTTADAVFLRDDWDALPPEIRPEAPLLQPAWTHRHAARWQPRAGDDPRTRVLYPHTVGPNGRRAVIDLEAFPRARAYLESHRARLGGRRYVIEAGRRWYEVWVPHDPAGWAAPKLVFPDIAEHPRGFLDTTGAVVNGDCYWLAPSDPADTPRLLLALAVLNSSFATAYYDARYHNKLYAGRRRFITQYVASFPLPDPAHPAAASAIALTARLTSGDCPEDEIATLDAACDRLVWNAFDLDPPSPNPCPPTPGN